MSSASRIDIPKYVGMVVAAALAITAITAWSGVGASHQPIAITLFAAAFVIVQLLPVPIPHGDQLEMVRFEEAVVLPMVLALRPIDALAAISIGICAGHILTKAPGIKTCFNVAQMVLATAACLAVVHTVAGQAPGPTPRGMSAALLGLVAMFTVNQVLVSGAMSRATSVRARTLLLDDLGLKALMWSANAALGLMLVLPLFQAPWLLGVTLVPLALLHTSYRAYVDRAYDEERLRLLHSMTQGMTRELSLDHTASHLVASARELVGGMAAELRLRDDARVYWARMEESGTIITGHSPGTDLAPAGTAEFEFSVPLSGRTGFTGILSIVHKRSPGPAARRCSNRDRTLLEMLVRHAETALDNALLFSRATAQRRKLAQIFDHSSEGLVVLSDTGRVLSWNPAMTAISHFSAEEVLDSPIALLSPQLAHIVEHRGGGAIHAVMTTADGSRRQLRASFAPIHESEGPGDGSAWVVVVRDITRERETERMKDDFVATVSHELRTPLTAIKGFLETMRRDDVAFAPGQVGMFLDIMSEQSDRLERLINDLLDMSAIESGRPLNVSLTPVDLSTEVHRAVRAFEAARPEAGVVVHESNMPLMAETDRHRLQQIITNLLENACKHGGTGAPIELSMAEINGTVTLAVCDQGRGISTTDAEHIFDRFYCTSDSATRTGGGAGLGLYICRKLLDAMGGSIAVNSRVGHGSTFTVELPSMRRGAVAGTR